MVRLWIDVEDLFDYVRVNPRPSGIQRLAFEICAALQGMPDCPIFASFVRHDSPRNSFRTVSWCEVELLFASLTDAPPEKVSAAPAFPSVSHPTWRRVVRKLVYRLPPAARMSVIDVLIAQRAALKAWAGLYETVMRAVSHRATLFIRRFSARDHGNAVAPAVLDAPATDEPSDFEAQSGPGDVILVLGAPWSHPDYAMLIQPQRQRGLKFALLVHDIIPLRRPEWFDQGLVRVFSAWFERVLPFCDVVFATSRATAADVAAYACDRGIHLPAPVLPVPVGSGFRARNAWSKEQKRSLPAAGSYALVVSTIEARKNHLLLFRVWRRLLDEKPAEQVPTLVFAGRVGWLVDDLMRQIANTGNLNGKLVIVENPSDVELATLYQGCLFTLFPSFSEGWGLPVTESLALGKPCITSDRSSLPEAGGKLTRRFDPDNLNEAYALIRAAIEDRVGLARWEAQIRREFRPTPWSATAKAILAGLGIRTAPLIDLEDARLQKSAAE
jgi:glycosyltransferase involved in cell wall biosynthesis